MLKIHELVDVENSAIAEIENLIRTSQKDVFRLPASASASAAVLLELQVTTKSYLGAVAFHTGGILVDKWLRIYGSGSEELPFKVGDASPLKEGVLVASDISGGFFAIDNGALDSSPGEVCYLAPDNLEWEPLGIRYSVFLNWAICDSFNEFFELVRWNKWTNEVPIPGNKCFSFYPPLWSNEGSVENSSRKIISCAEELSLRMEFARKLLK